MELDLQPRTFSQVSQTGCFFCYFLYMSSEAAMCCDLFCLLMNLKRRMLAFSARAGSAAKTYKELRSNFRNKLNFKTLSLGKE